MNAPSSFKDLLTQGIVSLALLPEKNDDLLTAEGKRYKENLLQENEVEKFHALPAGQRSAYYDLTLLDRLDGYTVPLVAHDYGAKTPVMWNTAYETLGLNIRNIMVVPSSAHGVQAVDVILNALKQDPKYLGGGAGVGFKEAVLKHLDATEPGDLKAVNIIVNNAGKLIGHNTDALGLADSLEEKLAEFGKGISGSIGVIIGAGGVAKEFSRELVRRKIRHLYIVNRTYEKAVALAHDLNTKYGKAAEGVGEHLLRGCLLNSTMKPAFVANLTDKGSDGPLANESAYAPSGEKNEQISRYLLEALVKYNPDIVHVDIVLPRSGRSVTLRQVDAVWQKEGLPAHTLDGKPMVIAQAVPAYKLIEAAHPRIHARTLASQELLAVLRAAATGERVQKTVAKAQ
jgi:shikimate 5-dehydrogenase